jgi:hypothetical protein
MAFRKFQYEWQITANGDKHLALTSTQFQLYRPLFACADTMHNQPTPESSLNFDALVATFDLEGFTPFGHQGQHRIVCGASSKV